ncbi:MAG: tetratricopeptide repeat protein [Tepidisphaeraceae bacterium]|jgi:predicted O-linked N-acetylglucosamine transferase (SPINDLY family)
MTQINVPEEMRIAVRHLQAGRLDEAERVLRQLLAAAPNSPDGLHLLAIVALQKGALDAGIDLIRRAIAINPAVAEYHSNLGDALRRTGKFDEAIAACRAALAFRPDFAEAYNNLGNALRQKGQLADAVSAYRHAVRLKPDYAEAYRNLGSALRDMEELDGPSDGAIMAFREAFRLRPDLPEIHNNLGCALRESGRLDEAIEVFRDGARAAPDRAEICNNLGNALNERGEFNEAADFCLRALRLRPQFPGACNNLGNALRGMRKLNEAMAAYRRAIELKPDYVEAHVNLGIALHDQGRLDEAIQVCAQAIQLDPACAEAHFNLGNMLHHHGRIRESLAARREAIRLRPSYAVAYGNLAGALTDLGELDEALAACETAVRIKPDLALVFSNLVYFALLHPGFDAAKILEMAKRWAQRFEAPLVGEIRPHLNDRSPGRRLRIGYVSPDYRRQAAGRFLAQLLANHDPEKVEVFCYSDVKVGDELTAQFRQWAHAWRDSAAWSDSELAGRIRADQIDILVDLALHTAGNRLPVFARKPAPVQATWLGYPGTTGLKSIDYRLTDRYLDPPGQGDEFYTEKSIHLPHCFWCYGPIGPGIEVSSLPALSAGYLTFGCLNNFTKVSDAVLELWASLLSAVPNSRLLIYMTRDRQSNSIARFSNLGVEANRIQFVEKQPLLKYLEEYNRIDIALDPFPYAGGTTTCDAMWMGVPTVTLRGRTAVGRGGVSILSNVGLPDWIAENPRQYVSIAAEMARDLRKLAELRAGLRKRMEQSPLMNAKQFATDMEAAYRQMWETWCSTTS